jgi:ferredoxin
MAKIQFLPAALALNVGVVVILLIMTLLIGRIYCSVICPLGVFQDIISWLSKRKKKNRFSYSPAHQKMRIIVLIVFVLLILLGFTSIASLIAPYSAYGRIASNIFAPIYQCGNNILACFAKHTNSYIFYSTNYVWIKSGFVFFISVLTLIIIGMLAWRKGRLYCNTICPIGSIIGFFSRFAIFKIAIDTSKCTGCKLCSRNCKASCINSEEHKIDYSRCVDCMDCMDKCRQGAIHYAPSYKTNKVTTEKTIDKQSKGFNDLTRRSFLTIAGTFFIITALKAQRKGLNGGLAAIKKKEAFNRKTRITPPGSLSANNMAKHCTACQLCVSECPNQVLRPSSNILYLMQPEMFYDQGFCRLECTRCSEVCPTDAIHPISKAEKSSIQIGHAVWSGKNCIVNTDNVSCGNCARHCPNGAIMMIPKDPQNENSLKIPIINEERCIGCGACEYVCPARPFSAIHVEGHINHKLN